MRVDKIELHGFKSFCDRTTFNLHPGMTCIVGPNGCGKSNVVDAFRWVLGEQSAKSLRGDKMEEVIFTGSHTKKPKGMSEVRLVVSGLVDSANGGEAPVTVGRRLYRSGDSEYMLNRNTCRLRDIRDIFLDTGLEVKSYSVLEQDRIAAILSAKPDERRVLLEEVAGVVKYKVRRNEAQSKLESSRGNLLRINDIVGEIKRQINSLDRQVKKAERYKRLTEELKEVELRIAGSELAELSGSLGSILSELDALKADEARRRAELSAAEGDIEAGRMGLVEKEKALEALLNELQAARNDIAEHERLVAVLKAETDSTRESIGRLRAEAQETALKAEAASVRAGEIEGLLAALEREIEELTGKAEEKSQLLSENESAITRAEGLLEEKRREAFRVSEELGTLRNAHGRHTEALEALGRKEAGLKEESEELASGLRELEGRLKKTEASIEEKERASKDLAGRRESLERDAQGLKEEIEALRAGTSAKREELASASSRLESLREMAPPESTAGDLGEDIKVLATVSDVVEVPREYERAIESALRETISALVMGAYDDIKLAVGRLKQRELGRTAFVPSVARRENPGTQVPQGAIARASDLVNTSGEYRDVVRSLLGNVAVVRDIESAIAMSPNGMTLVTLEGETVEPSGAVIAGKSTGILALKRKGRELEAEIGTIRSDVAALEARTAKAQSAMAAAESELREAGIKASEAERELSVLMLNRENQAGELDRARRKLEVIGMELAQASDDRASLQGQIEDKARQMEALEGTRKLVDEAMASIQREISEGKAAYELKRTESVDIRVGLTSQRERRASLVNEARSVSGLREELGRKAELLQKEIESNTARIAQREEEARAREDALRAIVVAASELEARIAAQRDALSADSQGIRQAEQALKGRRSEIELVSQKLGELDVQRAEHRLRIDNLMDKIRSAYSVELDDLGEEPLQEGDLEKRDEIKQKIERLGPVSLGSIEEYEELKERYDFLSAQQEDLTRSIAELEEAISKINSTTRKQLREAYEALKVKFGEVFNTLFGGGRAELVLTDERNILETGIDIIAQPPGKKLQNITLLSGGEKSLTALALLFASFLIKPTPLCILDEADAALDESNTFKFSQMLRELSGKIQFIVVTHNRVTMEAADYIYGITMEEPGVSKVISLELAEA